MRPEVKHNLINTVIIATPLTLSMIGYVLSGEPLTRNGALAFAFLFGSTISGIAAILVSADREWK